MFRYTKLTALRELFVWICTLFTLLPFYLLISTAFKPDAEIYSTSPMAPPTQLSVDSFISVFSTSGRSSIAMSILNSVIVTGGTLLLLITIASIGAYTIARSMRRWSTVAYYVTLIAIILPAQLGTVPLYMGARALGLTGTVWGLIFVWTALLMPLAVFLYAGFFRGLGIEYEEAAFIDGASPAQAFFLVVLPLMGPATGTVSILAGLIVWNDFFNALIFLGGTSAQTLPVAMYSYVGSFVSAWNNIFAVVIISMVPVLAFYMFAQKKFIQGFAGGLKG